MIYKLLIVTIFSYLTVYSTPQCLNFYTHQRSYLKKVVASNGGRLFVKDRDYSKDSVAKKWGGIFRVESTPKAPSLLQKYTSKARYAFKSIPAKFLKIDQKERYEFTPLQAFYEKTILSPSHWLSKKMIGREIEPALFSRLPVAILISLLAWGHIDKVYEHRVEEKITQNIVHYGATYMNFIQYDFRYRHIKKELDQGKISEVQAKSRSYLLSLAYAEYFENRTSNLNEITTLDSELKLLEHPGFAHLKKVFEEGVKPMPGFIIPSSSIGVLSEQQKLKLFEITHTEILRQQLIVEMINKTEVFNQAFNSPKLRELLELTVNSNFYSRLQVLKQDGQITDEQMISLLQEDIHWQATFEKWDTLGIRKLLKVGENYTSEFLTLSHIHLEMLNDLSKN